MADTTEFDELEPELGEEQDVLFRTQMKVYDLLVSNWKVLTSAVGVVLLAVLVFGLWEGHTRDTQRAGHASISDVVRNAPEPDPMAALGLGVQDDPNDLGRMSDLKNAAVELEQVASETSGTAKAFAWLKAAEFWGRAGESEAQLAALGNMKKSSSEPLLMWSAVSQMVNVHTQNEDFEKAEAELRGFVNTQDGFVAEQALFHLALLLEEAGKKEEAKKSIEDLTALNGESIFLLQAAELLARLGS